MTKREIVKMVLDGQRPPYVPWHVWYTKEAEAKLAHRFGDVDLEDVIQNHLLMLGPEIGLYSDVGDQCFQDHFGVVWDRGVDKEMGMVKGTVLPQPSLAHYEFPDPLDPRFFAGIPQRIERLSDRFRVFEIGLSLYERAWTLRGMQNFLMDFVDNPRFAHELLNAIAEYDMEQVREAMKYDIDAVLFDDDWGQQKGLQMGPRLWREFIYPVLRRMYALVRGAGRYVFIHSCGDVDELFDDLIGIGVNCFNPVQPEAMDVAALMPRYQGRLVFHGGLSTQRTLPFGTVEDVQRETRSLLDLGSAGSYIFAPSQDVQGDVPIENMLAFIELAQKQIGVARVMANVGSRR